MTRYTPYLLCMTPVALAARGSLKLLYRRTIVTLKQPVGPFNV